MTVRELVNVFNFTRFHRACCTKTFSKFVTYASVGRNLLKRLQSPGQMVKIQRVVYRKRVSRVRGIIQTEEKMEKEKKTTKKAVKEEKVVAVAEATETVAKTRTRKKAVKEEVFLQYRGMQVRVDTLLAEAKADWIARGNKEKDLASCRLYLKPEDRRAYYVINEVDEGNIPC